MSQRSIRHPALTLHRRSLRALTGVRLFAAGYVVTFHTQISAHLLESGHTVLGNFFFSGYLAVPLFFILSGFILAYTYSGQLEERGSFRRFWEARFARLWPAYAIALFSMSVPTLVFPPVAHVVAALFMVQAWNPWFRGLAGTWNYVCWTLSAESFFYLLFPWIQRRLERGTERAFTVLTVVSIALCVAMNSPVWSIGHDETGLLHFVPLTIMHTPEFLVGVGLGNYFLRHRWRAAEAGRPLPRRGGWSYLAAAVALAMLCLPMTRWTGLIVLPFALLVYKLGTEINLLTRLLSSPAAVFGGGISYSIYLMQLPVKAWVLAVTDRFGVNNRNVQLSLTAITLLLVSSILFLAVENPAREALRRLFAAVEQRRRAKRSVDDDWCAEGSEGS